MKKLFGKSAATAVLATVAASIFTPAAKADTYVIQPGDSFFSIADAYGVDPYQLAADNGLSIYSTILPGGTLEVAGAAIGTAEPVASTGASHMVQFGDSFSSIAAVYGVDTNELAAANGLSVYSTLMPGQQLIIPGVDSSAVVVESTTETVDDSYFLPGFQYEEGIFYPVGQCTWGVKKMTGWAGDFWGNAKDWAANAAADGYSVGYVPVVGAIAVWPNDGGGYGHVAYVSAVESETSIQVVEANYNGDQTLSNKRGWFNPQTAGGGSVVYIYPY